MSCDLFNNGHSKFDFDVISSINKLFIVIYNEWRRKCYKESQKIHYNIIILDISTDAEDQCPTWKTLGFEQFEIIVLTVIGLGAIYGTVKLIFRSKSRVAKWKKNKRKAVEKKRFENFRIKFESGKQGRRVTMVGATGNQTQDEQNRMIEAK